MRNVIRLRDNFGEIGEIFRGVIAEHADAIKEKLPNGVELAFVIDGNRGGEWVLVVDEVVSVRAGVTAWPDCRLACDGETMLKIIEGRRSSRDAFLKGDVRIQGDVGLLMALEEVLMNPTVQSKLV